VKFSIVIPTRNNDQTISKTIESCLNLNYSDFEIIIQDNSSNNETFKIIQQLNNSKIKYFKNITELHMTENWNLAVGNSSGEWVILLGGDDAIRRNALQKIEEVIQSTSVECITWSLAVYTWPNFGFPDKAQLLSIPPTTKEFVTCDVSPEFMKLLGGNLSGLPSIYYGCIKRSLIDKVLESGPLFDSRNPDLFSTAMFAFLTSSFVRINNPLTIAGFSSSSTITALVSKSKNFSEVAIDASNLLQNSKISIHELVPMVDLECTWVLDALLIARDRLRITDERFEITASQVARLIEGELNETFLVDAQMTKIIENWNKRYNQEIKMSQGSGLKRDQLKHLPLFGEIGKLGNFFVVNCRDLGVQDILEASYYLDVVEKVSPLLEMAHQDLLERVEKYEGYLRILEVSNKI
jgi:glycosyltransferase involved in cell wall biosynthesis